MFQLHTCTPTWSQRLGWMAAGSLVGAAVAYLADPSQGRRRRAELEQQGGRLARETADAARQRLTDEAQRATGSLAEQLPEGASPGDAVLEERIRAHALGPSSARTDAIVINVEHGVAKVRGQVEATRQRDDLIGRVHEVDGVQDVIDLTHLPGEKAPTRT